MKVSGETLPSIYIESEATNAPRQNGSLKSPLNTTFWMKNEATFVVPLATIVLGEAARSFTPVAVIE